MVCNSWSFGSKGGEEGRVWVGCVATLPVRSGAECHSPYAQPESLRFLLVESYREKTPYLAKWLEDNVLEGMAVFTLPDNLRLRLRTSNPAERSIQQELKRRTRKVRVFPNIESLERFISAVLVKIGDKWVAAEKEYIKLELQDD